jgi:hypothetical protein
MSISGFQGAGVSISAKVFPKCQCGKPYPLHIPPGCVGYTPVGPVRDLGTRAYRPSGGMSLHRRLACAILWSVELRLKTWRERFEQ